MADTPEKNAPLEHTAPGSAEHGPVEELPVGRWDRPSRWDECRFDPDEKED